MSLKTKEYSEKYGKLQRKREMPQTFDKIEKLFKSSKTSDIFSGLARCLLNEAFREKDETKKATYAHLFDLLNLAAKQTREFLEK